MDEPFGALDALTRDGLQTQLARIWERTGKTVVFVTHSIDEAVFLGRRVAVMSARPGSIKQVIDLSLKTDDPGPSVVSQPGESVPEPNGGFGLVAAQPSIERRGSRRRPSGGCRLSRRVA